MEKISEMIKRMCPEGVEKVKLSSLCISISTGLNPRTNFKLNEDGAILNYVTVKEIATNKIVFSDSTDKISDKAKAIINKRSRLEKGDILFSGIGTIGKVVYVDIETDNWDCSESVFLLKPNELVYGKFLSYTLISRAVISQYESCAAGAIMKGVRKATLENLDIPLPPLSIQQEIVRILDSFTSMITNLETELASRQKQYEYYRNKLLNFDENNESVEWKTLGDVSLYSKERINAAELDESNYVSVENLLQNKSGKVNSTCCPKDGNWVKYSCGDTLIGNIRPNLRKIWLADIEGGTNGDVLVIHLKDGFRNSIISKYLYYILSSEEFFLYDIQNAKGAKMPRGDKSAVMKFPIAYPSPQRQQEIVSILDTFESLISNVKQELEARKKQYEYYREQLLTFE